MKIKSFIVLNTNVSQQTVKLPQNCWILNFRYIKNKLQVNTVVEDDNVPLEDRKFFIVELSNLRYVSNEYDVNVDDLLLLGTCDSPHSQFFIFEVLPRE